LIWILKVGLVLKVHADGLKLYSHRLAAMLLLKSFARENSANFFKVEIRAQEGFIIDRHKCRSVSKSVN
jgi:hypothetical protein